MDEDCKKNLEKGKEYALYLLGYRDRSKNEIVKKLKEKNYDEEVIGEVICYLKEKNLLDDQKFAKEWANYSIKKGFSRKRVEQELRKKGVEEEIITNTLNTIFSQIDEEKMALEILERKGYLPLKVNLDKKEKLKQLSRILRFLSSRGFSYSTVEKLIKNYL